MEHIYNIVRYQLKEEWHMATVLTNDGLVKLEQELEELKTVKRKEVASKIKVALSFGDLSENSEYDEAKNEQARVEARIAQLESMLQDVTLVNEDELDTEKIHIGSRISIKDLEMNEVLEYRIVGSTEANPADGKISDESPVGKALLGHSPGEIVEVDVPAGAIQFEILEIIR